MRGHNTVEQNLMPDSWLILSPVAAPACGVHKNCKITFTPDGGAINVAKRGNKSESLPFIPSSTVEHIHLDIVCNRYTDKFRLGERQAVQSARGNLDRCQEIV